MAKLLLAVAVGYLGGRLVWLAARPWFAQPAFARPNYRGAYIPTSAGLVLPLAMFLVEAGRSVVAAAGTGNAGPITGVRVLALVLVTGFCLLGTVDDMAGTGDHRGFRGHLAALASGQVTTGLFKLLGGAAVALVVVHPLVGDHLGRLLADAALVALAANLGNLLDRAPGRATKSGLAAFAVLAALGSVRPALAGVAVVVGAALALLGDELRERLMLGDAGANALGAALGFGAVASTGPATRTALLLAVLLLNAVGEVASFSRVIEAVGPLRRLDEAGRPYSRRAYSRRVSPPRSRSQPRPQRPPRPPRSPRSPRSQGVPRPPAP